MSNLLKGRKQAFRDLEDKYSCDHVSTDLRIRTISGGGIQRVKQCLRCGRAASQPMGLEEAVEISGRSEFPAFDEVLKDSWEKAYDNESRSIIGSYDNKKEFQRAEFFKEYEKYLSSKEWRIKREKVLKRANGLCEGCGESEAEEVHHLSYKNVGKEFLFELVAICTYCHEALHEN